MFSQSIIKNETLRRKTKKIRDTGRRMTAIYSDYFNVNSSPIVSKFRKSGIFHRSNLSPKVVPSTKNATELPTKFLLDVLKYQPSKDLLKLRLVSKRFNEIIQNHALELPKVKTEVLNLCHPNCDPQEIKPIRKGCESMILENMDKPLRHLKTQRLTLTEITVTSKLIRFLHRSIKYQLKELRFVECKFLINLGFTDKFAKIFTDSSTLPSTIIFNNCLINITAKTVEAAIQSYVNLSKKKSPSNSLPQQYLWSLGTINDSYGSILSTLSNFEEYIVSQN
uniref:F-box domain-containing protein n=1 Tax=Panagrolaimus sp. ES5 TaxID=591445 RepID=A0AC34G0T3_9BILA